MEAVGGSTRRCAPARPGTVVVVVVVVVVVGVGGRP